MLHWAMGYDPIVEGVELACGLQDPTFVDDLAANTRGPQQTMATELFLIAASHCAGLLIDGHECEWLTCTALHPEAQTALATLPVRITSAQGVWTIRGLRPAFAADILHDQLGPGWAADVRFHSTPCRCGTKTAVVPQAALRDWQAVLATSPFGASSAVPQ